MGINSKLGQSCAAIKVVVVKPRIKLQMACTRCFAQLKHGKGAVVWYFSEKPFYLKM